MPPTWDEREQESGLYEPVHHHTSGVISYTLSTPTATLDPHSEAYRLLQELREKAQESAPCEVPAD